MEKKQKEYEKFLERTENRKLKEEDGVKKNNKVKLEVGERFGPLDKEDVPPLFNILSKRPDIVAVAFDRTYLTDDAASELYKELRKNTTLKGVFIKYDKFEVFDAKNFINIINTSNKTLYIDVTSLTEAQLKVFRAMLGYVKDINKIRLVLTEEQRQTPTVCSIKKYFLTCRCIKENKLNRLPHPCKSKRTSLGGWKLDLSKADFRYEELKKMIEDISIKHRISDIRFPSTLSEEEKEKLQSRFARKRSFVTDRRGGGYEIKPITIQGFLTPANAGNMTDDQIEAWHDRQRRGRGNLRQNSAPSIG